MAPPPRAEYARVTVHAAKLNILIPESHRVELTLPADLPSGPAELTVVVAPARGEGARARAMGMDAGTGWIADDFDAPLPDDVHRSFENDE
jgi:hypothetical protein